MVIKNFICNIHRTFAPEESKSIDNESNTISQSIYKDTRL